MGSEMCIRDSFTPIHSTRRDRPRALETLRATPSPVPYGPGSRKRRETGASLGKALRKMAKQIARRPSLAAHDANARCRSRCAGDLDVTLDVSAAYSRGRTLFTHTRIKTALSVSGSQRS